MNSAHDLMAELQRDGAARFGATGLATDHAGVARKVRRDRAVRATVFSVAGVAVAGAAAVGLAQLTPTQVTPAVTPTAPSGGPTAEPTPSAPPAVVTLSVGREDRIENVARNLAIAMGTREDDAFSAITGALPPEAGGYAEGWVLAGEYTLDPEHGLESAAKQLVSMTTAKLESLGVPRDEWFETVVLASIVQQEAPAAYADQAGVARVLLNRLDERMMLQIESPLAYYLRADEREITDDGWAVDTPYNTYMYEGLPPSAVGAFTPEALEAAVNPTDADWMFFLRKEDGNVVFSTTLEEHQVAVEEEYPGTIG